MSRKTTKKKNSGGLRLRMDSFFMTSIRSDFGFQQSWFPGHYEKSCRDLASKRNSIKAFRMLDASILGSGSMCTAREFKQKNCGPTLLRTPSTTSSEAFSYLKWTNDNQQCVIKWRNAFQTVR